MELQNGKLFSHSPYSYAYDNPLKFIDPDGKTPIPWDYLDIGFAVWSVKDFVTDPTWSNAGWAVYDMVAAVAPILPSSRYFRAGGQMAESTIDAWGAGRKADKAVDFAKRGQAVWESFKDGDKLHVDEAIQKGLDFLGKGHDEIAPGVFRSADGKRQFRMTMDDILGNHGEGPHFNFEIMEPNPRKPGKMRPKENKHLYFYE